MRYCIRPDDKCSRLSAFLKQVNGELPLGDLDDVRIIKVDVDLANCRWTLHLDQNLDQVILDRLQNLHECIPGLKEIHFCCDPAPQDETDPYMQLVLQQRAKLQEQRPENGTAKPKQENNVIKGRKVAQPPVPIRQLGEPGESVVIKGELMSLESRVIRRGGSLLIMDFTDYTDSITAKLFVDDEDQIARNGGGQLVCARGLEIDRYSQELCLTVRDVSVGEAPKSDEAEVNVELHLHSRMSAMTVWWTCDRSQKAAAGTSCNRRYRSRLCPSLPRSL